MSAEEVKEHLLKKRYKPTIGDDEYVSTGSTLLNLACTDRYNCGFSKGKYYFYVGDSSSGKSFLALTCLAEASHNRQFDGYKLIYDNAENGALMNIKQFFGSATKARLTGPRGDDENFSITVEDFYDSLDRALDEGPCIYILDSMDVLTCEADVKHAKKVKNAKKREESSTGSYGTGKAKVNSERLRLAIPKLKKAGSILIIISQTRDNIGTFSFEKKTRSGGHALKFYATLEIWTSLKEKIKKVVNEKSRTIGIKALAKVKKNRVTGRDVSVDVHMYFSFGVDDVGSCVDYLIDEGHWKKNGSKINAKEFDYTGIREKLIQKIEDDNEEQELRLIVAKVWSGIKEACAINRKRRYD